MSNLIFDDLTGIPTLLAPARAERKNQFDGSTESAETEAGKPKKRESPFTKGNEHLTPPTLYQDADDWSVRVIPNKYPLVEDHEVIIHSPDPARDIEDMDHETVVKIIRAYLNRINFHNSKGKEAFLFNNRGGKAGASIPHPHSQLIALKGFPGIIEREKEAALKYFNEHTSCPWCDKLISEREHEKRVVFESNHFVLFVPEASRWSYEMLLIPKGHKPNIVFIDEMEINDFADCLRKALRAYDSLLNRPDRNFWIHTAMHEPFHWHVGFIPQIKTLGGLELGAGIWVSDKATPEDAAKGLKFQVENHNGGVT